jgi:hypothetical protein
MTEPFSSILLNIGKIVGVAMITRAGKFYTLPMPNRHGDVIGAMRLDGVSVGDIAKAEQGFVTERGTYVGRIEAMHVAKAHGQIRTLRMVDGIERVHEPTGPELFSEDLW